MLLPGAQKKGFTSSTQSDPKLFWKSFEEKYYSTLPCMPQEALDYCTKLYTLGQSINDHFVPNM